MVGTRTRKRPHQKMRKDAQRTKGGVKALACRKNGQRTKRWKGTKASFTSRRKRKRTSTKKKKTKKKRTKKTNGRLPHFEGVACGFLSQEFGACDRRKRKMVLAQLGIVSRTNNADGTQRKRSTKVRFLEFDYIRDDVFSTPSVVEKCLSLMHPLCNRSGESYAWLRAEHLRLMAPVCVSVEIDGIQHVKPVKRWSGARSGNVQRENDLIKRWSGARGGNAADVQFLAQRENDLIKEAYCRLHSIIMKRIPNYDPKQPKAWTCTKKVFRVRVADKIEEIWIHIIKRVEQNIANARSV